MDAEGFEADLELARRRYDDEDTSAFMLEAARTESAGYCKQTRVEEIMAFANRLGAEHLGVAFCVGLAREAGLLRTILERNGFRVSSVCCKVGSIPKEEIGLTDAEKIRPGQYEAACNPVLQARLLDNAGAKLNIVVGLCVGHDSIFFKNSVAPVTVLVAKDRVLGHNPVAALYTSRSCYSRLRCE
ncbi:MAG: DUF1847 domain-containing protein [Proteobacteria bacterium]|nr:DUF1847 domain-containing protein [Pseudomonadota bacterium]